MKKFTFLFAAMLAMSGLAFGQKEGKVLWENLVESKPATLNTGNTISMTSYTPFVSPSGNTLINYYYNYGSPFYVGNEGNGIKAYDKKGQPLWKTSDYYKNPNASVFINYEYKDYYTLQSIAGGVGTAYEDSLFLFDKDFKFQKGFNTNTGASGAFVVRVEDGIFYNNPQKTLIKYDLNAKEEWRFNSKDAINIVTRKAPYLGLVFTQSDAKPIILFDKKGNKKGETSPQTFNAVYPTNDNGFWLSTSSNIEKAQLIRYDSTGKELVKVSVVSLLGSTFSYTNFIYRILPNNSMTLTYLDSDFQMIIIRIDEKGKVTKIQKDLGIKTDVDNGQIDQAYIESVGIAKSGTVKFNVNCVYLSKINPKLISKFSTVFGAENFDNLKFGWNKTIISIVEPPVVQGFLSEDDVFQVSSKYFSGKGNNFKYGEVNYYELDGKLRWSYSDVSINQFSRKGNQVYAYQTLPFNNGLSSLYVLDYDTGKMLWKKEDININYTPPYQSDIKIDKLGNTYFQFYKFESSVNKLNFQVIKRDGTVFWKYNSPHYINAFEVADDGIIATTFEYTSSDLKYFIRKISPCEDLNALTITGKTEACPTEKVKLSVPKQEGITYQWQKDGKDIPNTKDVVYDFGESGTYTVVVKDELCQNTVVSKEVKITIRPLPNTEITAPKSTFCDGEKTTIASRTNGTFFQWQKDGKDILNATSGILEVSQAGDYRVGVRDDKCPQVGYSNIYTIITKLLPEATILTDIKGVVYEPFTVKMSANTGTGFAYQWLKDDVSIPDETKATFEAKKSGKYKVNVTYDGCTKLSDALTISILIPLANSEEIGEEEVKVYPNPSKGEFKIILPKSLKSADVQLFDAFGRERSLVYVEEQAQAEGLVQGVYFVRISKGEKSVTSKIIIE